MCRLHVLPSGIDESTMRAAALSRGLALRWRHRVVLPSCSAIARATTMRMSEVGPSLSSPTSAGRGSRQRISKDAKSRACLVCQSARSRSMCRTLRSPPQTGPANSERRTRCPQAPIDGGSRLTSRLHQIAPPPRGRSKAVNLARAAAAARAFYFRRRCHASATAIAPAIPSACAWWPRRSDAPGYKQPPSAGRRRMTRGAPPASLPRCRKTPCRKIPFWARRRQSRPSFTENRIDVPAITAIELHSRGETSGQKVLIKASSLF
jgi:hypothetical protein